MKRRLAWTLITAVLVIASLVLRSNWSEVYFYLQFEGLGRNEQGFEEYRHRNTGIVFVEIPPGEFMMGTSEEELNMALPTIEGVCRSELEKWFWWKLKLQGWGETWDFAEGDAWDRLYEDVEYRLDGEVTSWCNEVAANEMPQRRVVMTGFLIGKYEVTCKQWEGIMGSGKRACVCSECPVAGLSLSDCVDFCARSGLQLPTEAQWEYACRGRQTTGWQVFAVPWQVPDISYTREDPPLPPLVPVGTKAAPNGYGLYDMHDNVSEQCLDAFTRKGDLSWIADGSVDPAWVNAEDAEREGTVVRGANVFSSNTLRRCAARGTIGGGIEIVGLRCVYKKR